MPPKGQAKKKGEAQKQCHLEKNDQTPGRRNTRQSMAAAITPKASITPMSKKKLNEIEIVNLVADFDEDSDYYESCGKSFGKNENISNFKMDDHSITVKIRRMSDQKTYKVVEYKLGMKKVDASTTSTESTGLTRRSRSCKNVYSTPHEIDFLQNWQHVSRERSRSQSRRTDQDIPRTPSKRRSNEQKECESVSEDDENTMPNANLSPKRPKVVESKIANTPRKAKTVFPNTPKKGKPTIVVTPLKTRTPSKSAILSLPQQTPSKDFSNLCISSPKTRKSIKPLKSNNIQQVIPKRYELRTKKSEAIYTEFSSDTESGDDGDKNYDSNDDSQSSEDEDYASDDSEMFSVKRPKSAKKKVLRTPSKSNVRTSKVSMETPTKLISRMSLNSLTPSIHRRTMNIVKPSTPLQEARQKLHVSVLPKSLPCREEEFNNIYTFLHSRLTDLSGGCIYVSGVPGTGKTATVNEVIRCLKKSVNAGKLNEFEFVEINGMKLSEPRQAYVQIWKQLSGNQATWEVAQTSLHNRFTTANSKRGMTLLLVDELDLLCTKRQDVVYNLLDWPSKATAKLVVVTIANTMDLPERILMGKVTSRLGLTRLTFPPYNHKQLEEIVASRLKGYDAFSGDTVQLVARKVAAVSGDARRALDICRRATEVAEINDREIVTMADVKTALDEMIASPKIQAIRACSDLEKIFLQAVCSEVNRTGVEEVLFKNVYFQLESLCRFEREKVPNVTEALSMCARLGAWRLLLCDHSKLDIHQRLILNVSTDDVQFAIRKVET